jgi:hypothetical protein
LSNQPNPFRVEHDGLDVLTIFELLEINRTGISIVLAHDCLKDEKKLL